VCDSVLQCVAVPVDVKLKSVTPGAISHFRGNGTAPDVSSVAVCCSMLQCILCCSVL